VLNLLHLASSPDYDDSHYELVFIVQSSDTLLTLKEYSPEAEAVRLPDSSKIRDDEEKTYLTKFCQLTESPSFI